MRLVGRISLCAFWLACARATAECMNEECALFMHVRRSPRRFMRGKNFRIEFSRRGAETRSCGGMAMGDTTGLQAAKRAKKDEFYTQRVDIENELRHYKSHFKGKVVLCNCDDPRQSEFFKYFTENFEKLGLKRLIATCYKSQDVDLFSQGECERAVYQIYEGDKNGNMTVDDDEVSIRYLDGDGDFRSAECIEILKQADIIVTNPPFSLFREYVAQLIKYKKKFLIIGNVNSLICKEIFPLVIHGDLWLGASIHSGDRKFGVPEDYPLDAASCGVDENDRDLFGLRVFDGLRIWIIHSDMKRFRYTRNILLKNFLVMIIMAPSMSIKRQTSLMTLMGLLGCRLHSWTSIALNNLRLYGRLVATHEPVHQKRCCNCLSIMHIQRTGVDVRL